MLEDITIGQYVPGNSVLHRLDPRTKIVGAIIFMIGLFMVNNALGYISVAVFSLFLVVLSRVPFRFVLRGLKPIIIIVFFTMVLHFFLTPGSTLVRIGPLTVTLEGLRQGIFMSTRLILLVLVTSLLTLTTSPISLTDGLELLMGPGRKVGLPAHELAMMMSIALRFIPTFLQETDKIMKAQKARGADFESGNIFKRAKSLVPILVPLFVSAFRRADDLATAMEARCYRGGGQRTRMRQLRLEASDYLSFAIVVVVLVWSVVTRFL